MEFQNVRRIALFKFRNIGDILLMTPALHALRERFPQAHITAVVNEGTEAMLAHHPDLQEVLVLQRLKMKEGVLKKIRYELGFLWRIVRGKYDLTISFTEGDRGAWYSLLAHARYRIGWAAYHWKKLDPRHRSYNKPLYTPHWLKHEVEKHYLLLEKAGLKLPLHPLQLVIPAADQQWAKDLLRPLAPRPIVHLHPVSRWLFKCWSNQKMSEIIDWLQEKKGVGVVVTSGPNEAELALARDILAGCRTQPLFVPGTASLTQTAALSAEATLFLGVDTAPMHMAAAARTPVVALFGPTHARNWHPWQTEHRVVSTRCFCNESQEKCDWTTTRACLAAISVEDMKQAVEELWTVAVSQKKKA